jgi:hypothetical protein
MLYTVKYYVPDQRPDKSAFQGKVEALHAVNYGRYAGRACGAREKNARERDVAQ